MFLCVFRWCCCEDFKGHESHTRAVTGLSQWSGCSQVNQRERMGIIYSETPRACPESVKHWPTLVTGRPGTSILFCLWDTWPRQTWPLWRSGVKEAASTNICMCRRPTSRCSSWWTSPDRRRRAWSECLESLVDWAPDQTHWPSWLRFLGSHLIQTSLLQA